MIWLEHYGNRLYGFMGYVVDEAEGADWARERYIFSSQALVKT